MDVTSIRLTTSEGKEVDPNDPKLDPNDPKLVNALRYEFQEILE